MCSALYNLLYQVS